MNKKGRPLSQSSLKRFQDEELLRNVSAQQPMTKSEREDLVTILKNMKLAEDEVLKKNRISPTIPKDHAYEMASIGPEMTDSQINLLLEKDRIQREKVTQNQKDGSRATRDVSIKKAEVLYKKNKQLIDQISRTGNRTVNQVANVIKNDWINRGYLGPPPTEKTIQNQIRKFIK